MNEYRNGIALIIVGLGLGITDYFSLIPHQIAFLGPVIFLIGNLYLVGQFITNIRDKIPEWNAKLEVQKWLEKKDE